MSTTEQLQHAEETKKFIEEGQIKDKELPQEVIDVIGAPAVPVPVPRPHVSTSTIGPDSKFPHTDASDDDTAESGAEVPEHEDHPDVASPTEDLPAVELSVSDKATPAADDATGVATDQPAPAVIDVDAGAAGEVVEVDSAPDTVEVVDSVRQ